MSTVCSCYHAPGLAIVNFLSYINYANFSRNIFYFTFIYFFTLPVKHFRP